MEIKKHGSLFTGLGGFDLAAEWMGWKNVFQVENNEWCIKNLTKNFPETKRYADIFDFNGKPYARQIDILTGGFPCQTFSVAGKGAVDLTLWKEMYRCIKEIQSPFVVAENVPGIVSRKRGMAFETVCADLEIAGYQVQPLNLPVAGKGAPHERERIWFVAYSDRFRCDNAEKGQEEALHNSKRNSTTEEQKRNIKQRRIGKSDSDTSNLQSSEQKRAWHSRAGRNGFTDSYTPNWSRDWTEVASELCRMDDGLPKELDRAERIEAGGNSLSPQVAYEIFKAIEQVNQFTPIKPLS